MPEKVITTYLEITEKDQFRPKEGYLEKMEVREVRTEPYLSAVLFAGVGLPWSWYSRLGWTMEEWDDYLSDHNISTYLCFSENELVGYYQLEFDDSSSAEIRYLGLFPQYMGRSLGGMILSHAIRSAFDKGATRIWLHTCTKDADAALGNYLARGFRVFRTKEEEEDVPDKNGLIARINRFFSSYIDRYGNLS